MLSVTVQMNTSKQRLANEKRRRGTGVELVVDAGSPTSTTVLPTMGSFQTMQNCPAPEVRTRNRSSPSERAQSRVESYAAWNHRILPATAMPCGEHTLA